VSEEKLDRILALLEGLDEEQLYQRVKARLAEEAPALLKVLTVTPQIQLEEKFETIEVDGKTPKGRVARLILDGWFDTPKNANKATEEINRRGGALVAARVYEACDALVALGFLYKQKLANRSYAYVVVEGMKANVRA
jgi:hypothetical protein